MATVFALDCFFARLDVDFFLDDLPVVARDFGLRLATDEVRERFLVDRGLAFALRLLFLAFVFDLLRLAALAMSDLRGF